MKRALWLSLCVWLVACAAERGPYVWAAQLPAAPPPELAALAPGDHVIVDVANQEALSGERIVREDGAFLQPLVGKVPAQGRTPSELARYIEKALSGLVEQPRVTVAVVSRRPPSVAVIGEVREPGQFQIEPAEGMLSVLARAGGLTEFADPDHIYVVRRHPTRLMIRVCFDDLVSNPNALRGLVLQHGDVIVVD